MMSNIHSPCDLGNRSDAGNERTICDACEPAPVHLGSPAGTVDSAADQPPNTTALTTEPPPGVVVEAKLAESQPCAIDGSEPKPEVLTQRIRARRVNPSADGIWPRHHAICMMGVVCDKMLGGFDEARAAVEPLKNGLHIGGVADSLLAVSGWLLNARYMNFDGSAGLTELGLERCFRQWVRNRVYYFYYEPAHSEHPVFRKKANLGAAYREFYDSFGDRIAAHTEITEDEAREFWISVADRVPFVSPDPVLLTAVLSEVFAAPSSDGPERGGDEPSERARMNQDEASDPAAVVEEERE